MSAQAALYVEVDKATKTYYVSGSASGAPGEDPFVGGSVFFDNGQPTGGGYTNFFSATMFQVSGNAMSYASFYLHANGNINGNFSMESTNYCTITANPGVRLSYAGFEAALITELEAKADAMETLPATEGDTTFTMTIRNAPEIVHVFSLSGNGYLTWTNANTNLYYTVEWCPGLEPDTWTGNYSTLVNIHTTQDVIQVPIPMFFRVRGHPNPQYPP